MPLPQFIRPRPFPLRRDRFLFCDAFIRDRRLVLVSTYYPDLPFDFATVAVWVDGVRRARFEEIGRNAYEPVRAIVYALDDLPLRDEHEIVVRYDHQDFSARIAPDPIEPGVFSLATLFKDDFDNLDLYLDYYRRQGVERFYLFYNGDLARLPATLPRAPDVVWGEWDFRYWLHRNEPPFNAGLVDAAAVHNAHHAQMTFITMARHRILPASSYLALIDLDELLAVPGQTVRAHVEAMNLPALAAQCYWAEVRAPGAWSAVVGVESVRNARAFAARWRRRIFNRLGVRNRPRRLTPADLDHLWANDHNEGYARMKTIYRGDFQGHVGIHGPKSNDARISRQMKLYQLIDTAHGRYDLIKPDARPVSLP